MSLSVVSHHAKTYQVSTDLYAGPLDLLLQLIERAELDITRLALAQVTDQYLEHLRILQEHSAEEVSAFVVIASRLLQIKSEALLPRPPVRAVGEEDPGEALARQLLIYKRFREIAGRLARRESAGLRTHLRLAAPKKVFGTLDLSGVTLADLVDSARSLYAREASMPDLRTVVGPPRVTIREKISLIASTLRKFGRSTFNALLEGRNTRLHMVVTFLALLELVKRRMVTAQQAELFGEIELQPSDEWDENTEFELEFGE
jgi:segregation and condensation protein A